MQKADKTMTPGSFDPAVTIEQVLESGFSASRRPTRWQALKLKGKVMKAYGIRLTPAGWHAYTLDHLVPLSLGGMPLDINNLWPQYKDDAKAKDRDEAYYLKMARKRAFSLATVQQWFMVSWSG